VVSYRSVNGLKRTFSPLAASRRPSLSIIRPARDDNIPPASRRRLRSEELKRLTSIVPPRPWRYARLHRFAASDRLGRRRARAGREARRELSSPESRAILNISVNAAAGNARLRVRFPLNSDVAAVAAFRWRRCCLVSLFSTARSERKHTGQQLAYVYFEEEPGRRSAAKLLTRDEAHCAHSLTGFTQPSLTLRQADDSLLISHVS
jgi:hypothetical protein